MTQNRILCKLTDNNDQTYNSTQWGEGVTHTASGEGELCSEGWIHYYSSPLLAILLNPVHANFKNPHLWSVKVSGESKSDGLKLGAESLTTIKRIPLPELTITQKVIFGILCAMEVYRDEKFQWWGKSWVDGSDRSAKAVKATEAETEATWKAATWAAAGKAAKAAVKAAEAAAEAAWKAAEATTWKAAEAAAWKEWKAAKAVKATEAATEAETEAAWKAAWAETEAAWKAAWAAEAAAKAAWAAAKAGAEIDFHVLAEKAFACV